MAEEATTRGEAPRRGRKRLVLALGALPLLAVVGVVSFVLLRPAEAEGAPPPPPPEGEIIEVAQMTANLAQSGRYARVTFAVVLREGADASAVEASFPLLKDAALTTLSGLSADDLRGPEGVGELRSELTDAARRLHPEGEVSRVVLTDLVIQ
jgi:flagellar basal body-associated protein FliL